MFRLDRTAFKAGNFKNKQKESDNYKDMTLEEIGKVFAYLQSVAYNYPLGKPPRMDKTVHSFR